MARSGIIWGPSGSFKTTAVAHMSHYIAETTGKATLLLSADGGGWEPCQEEVTAGMIRPYRVDSQTIPLPIIRKVSQGYWPENVDEPDISKVNFLPVNWDEVGAIAVEGITSIGTMLMRHYADKNIKSGEEATSRFAQPIRVNGEISNEWFAQNSKGHYGGVQNQLYSMVMNFQSLPLAYFLMSGHEQRYTEDGEALCGVKAPGKAITPMIPSWFGDCIHAQDYKEVVKVKVPDGKGGTVDEDKVEIHARYYYQKHWDPATGVVFDAKARVTHSKTLELVKRFPGGFFVPTPNNGLDIYLRTVDELAKDAAQSDKLKNWRQKMDAKRMGRSAVAK
jgi:hypothetical protein